MNECWTIEAIPSAGWEADKYGTSCVSDQCRINSAVLARAILGYAMLGVPCDYLFVLPPPSYDPTALSGRALSGAAISNTP